MSTQHPGPQPVDPASLPDPEDITEADLPEPPPRPGREHRRFAGTQQQIRSATRLYVVCAWITGIMLLLLVAEMVLKYGMHVELYAGGTTLDGDANGLGLHPTDSVTGGVNLSLFILIAHGWMYVVYLLASFRLWSLMRWEPLRLLAMAGGGVVPFLSFVVEKRMTRVVRDELHRFWPPERAHVESGYRELPFPFPGLPMPQLSIDVAWSPERLLGYVRSWSAAKAALAAGQGGVIEAFEADARALPPDSVIAARFPLALRVGRVG